MKRAARLLGLLVAWGLGCALPMAAGTPPEDPMPNGDPRELVRLLNASRAEAGLKPLAWDEKLAAAARTHAELMARHNQLTHQFPGELPLRQRLNAVLLSHSGENVAVDYDVAGAHTGFMYSPPHRANILDAKFNAVGVGIVRGGSRIWVVEDFAERQQEYSAEDAAVKMADAFDRARREAGAPRLTRSASRRMPALACTMTRKNRLDVSEALTLPGARYATAYTAVNVEDLPASALSLRDKRDTTRYAVGVCFDRTPEYPSGAYWVLLVLFAN